MLVACRARFKSDKTKVCFPYGILPSIIHVLVIGITDSEIDCVFAWTRKTLAFTSNNMLATKWAVEFKNLGICLQLKTGHFSISGVNSSKQGCKVLSPQLVFFNRS